MQPHLRHLVGLLQGHDSQLRHRHVHRDVQQYSSTLGELQRRMRLHRVLIVGFAVMASCIASREEVLDGKVCDPDSACADGYECDPSTKTCVPADSSGDGGGGNGGGTSCSSVADCPPPVADCDAPVCLGRKCQTVALRAGEPVIDQTEGDCSVAVCDESGAVVQTDDDDDIPVDGDECTDDVCSSGVPSNPNAPAGTPCSGGTCNAMGMCS